MRVKLYESKWENKVTGELAKKFYDTIMASDIEGVKEASVALLTKCEDFFDEDEEYIINEIEALINEISEAEEEDDIDSSLEELYDFCDGYSILIDVREEPEDAEVFVGDDNGDEDEEENIPSIEIDPETDEIVEISDEDIEESCKSNK